MNKRQTKKQYKKSLMIPKLALLGNGLLTGYICPTCGINHIREPFCPNCGQNLRYEKNQLNQPNRWRNNEEWIKVSDDFFKTKNSTKKELIK